MDFRLLRNRNFSFFAFGNAITVLGDEFLTIAMSLYILNLTGSASKFSTVIAAALIPSVLLSPVAGSIVDRFNKKYFLVTLDLFRGLLLVCAFLYTLIRTPGEFEIYSVSLIFGICGSFYTPASSTIIPSLLQENELTTGNMLNSVFVQVSKIIAPFIGALVYSFSGLSFIFLIDAITFFIISIVIVFIKFRSFVNKNSNNSFVSNIIDGFKLFKDREVLSISLNGMLTHLLVFPIFYTGYPYILKSVFRVSDINYGIVQTVCSIGTVFTFITVHFVSKRYNNLKALNFGMYGMLGAILLLFGLNCSPFYHMLVSNHIIMTVYFAVIGFIFWLFFATYGVFYSTFIQKKVVHSFLGRFYAILGMMIGLGGVVGNKIYGYIFDHNIAFYPILLACVGMIIKLVLNFFTTPEKKLGVNLEA